jgi:hypothetical protein
MPSPDFSHHHLHLASLVTHMKAGIATKDTYHLLVNTAIFGYLKAREYYPS